MLEFQNVGRYVILELILLTYLTLQSQQTLELTTLMYYLFQNKRL